MEKEAFECKKISPLTLKMMGGKTFCLLPLLPARPHGLRGALARHDSVMKVGKEESRRELSEH